MAVPSVIYSIAIPLNRGGMSTIAWHACLGLQQAGLLCRVLAPETKAAGSLAPLAQELPWAFQKIMAVLNRLQWHRLHDDFFDRWASTWIKPGMEYYGWLNQSLACIRKCHRGGGRTFVDRGSVEPRLQQHWLREEYAKYGLRCNPMDPLTVQRMIQEANEADIIVTPSKLVADSYVAAGYKPCKLAVNPLGVDLRSHGFTKNLNDSDKMRFVFVGQISIQKGIPDLLQAWKKLAPDHAELVLAGVIPFKERRIIRPLLRTTPRLVWNGHSHDVPGLLQTCDILVLPSAQDGFGMVVLEAFASGLPVIVSDRVGAQDCVIEGKNGFVFQFGDTRALEERLEWFLQDPYRSQEMAIAAGEAAKGYTWENYGRRVASLFSN